VPQFEGGRASFGFCESAGWEKGWQGRLLGELAPLFDKTALEELGPADTCLELVEVLMLGVVGTMAISELGVAAVIRVTAQCFQKGSGKSRAGVVVLEKALEGLSKEDVFHRRATVGVLAEVRGGFGFQFAQAAGDGLGMVDFVEDFSHRQVLVNKL
jgi:hypothetical protein